MTDHISITGLVATDPRSIVTNEGLAICSFRIASPQRHFSRMTNQWVDGETNWYTVSMFRQMAENAAASLRKGERIIVRGKLKLRQWERDEKTGLSAEIEAESIGHDLRWGSSEFTRAHTESLPDQMTDGDAGEEDHAVAAEVEKVPF